MQFSFHSWYLYDAAGVTTSDYFSAGLILLPIVVACLITMPIAKQKCIGCDLDSHTYYIISTACLSGHGHFTL